MDDYTKHLLTRFRDIPINLVVHDTSPCGMPAYIKCSLGATPKDKGDMVLDLGNYIYRVLGLKYQMTPEYRGRGKSTTLRWFMSWDDIQPIRPAIFKAYGISEGLLRHREYLPFEFRSLIIQNTARGVFPSPREDSK